MNRSALRFWGTAAGTSIVFAALVPVLFPFRAAGLDPATERVRIWLLVVFCVGAMLVLMGAGAWIGGQRSMGLRDIADARGVQRALERAKAARQVEESYTHNAAAWCVATGGLLVLIYFALYAALG